MLNEDFGKNLMRFNVACVSQQEQLNKGRLTKMKRDLKVSTHSMPGNQYIFLGGL